MGALPGIAFLILRFWIEIKLFTQKHVFSKGCPGDMLIGIRINGTSFNPHFEFVEVFYIYNVYVFNFVKFALN